MARKSVTDLGPKRYYSASRQAYSLSSKSLGRFKYQKRRAAIRHSKATSRFCQLEKLTMRQRDIGTCLGSVGFCGKWKKSYRMVVLQRCIKHLENLQYEIESNREQLEQYASRLGI
jgi:hypothetical protein